MKQDDSDGFKVSIAYEHDSRFWLYLPGRSLESIEKEAIRASHARHLGHRRSIMTELSISKSNLLRKLDELGLRKQPGAPTVVSETETEQPDDD